MKNNLIKHFKPVFILVFVAAFTLYGCSGRETFTEKNFVGKWKSSKLETPVYLYANGEWEIKPDDGAVLQYGVWQYQDKKIIWSFKQSDSHILHDVNPVLSATPQEFQVQENDRTITTFKKLD
jgi:hypothetical protein